MPANTIPNSTVPNNEIPALGDGSALGLGLVFFFNWFGVLSIGGFVCAIAFNNMHNGLRVDAIFFC